MFIRADLRGKGESWDLDSGSKTPLATFRTYENGVKVWGRRVHAEASGAHRVGAVGQGSRLLGGLPAQGTVPGRPAPASAPARRPRRPGLTSQGPTKRILAFSIAVRRPQAGGSPPPPGGEEATAPIGSLRFHGDGGGPRGPTGVGGAAARGLEGRGRGWAGGWAGSSGWAAWVSGLEAGVQGWREGGREAKNPDPDSLLTREDRRAHTGRLSLLVGWALIAGP